MFGVAQRDHDVRYEYADEFFEALDALFTTDGYFDFEGEEYFSIKKAFSEPKPVQRPHPVYMSAAVSPRGREFAARWSDISFQAIRDFKTESGVIAATKQNAKEKYGRTIQVAASVVIVCADTEKEARDYFQYYVHEKGDRVAAEKLVRTLFPQVRDASGAIRQMPPEMMDHFVTNMVAGHGATIAIGTPEQVVETLQSVSAAGVDLCTLGWVDFEAGIAQYVDKIHPLMVQAGLRVDENPPPALDLGAYRSPAVSVPA